MLHVDINYNIDCELKYFDFKRFHRQKFRVKLARFDRLFVSNFTEHAIS